MAKASIIRRAILAFALCIGAGLAQGAEVTLRAPGAPDEMRDALRGASLSIARADQKSTTPQDLLAAARADYGRLLGALYAGGYYSGVIRISVDGREAAALSPFAAPARIERIAIVVETGPAFTFARAEVAPLPGGFVLPEGFGPGGRARSGLIQEAAQEGIRGWRDLGHAKARVAGQRLTADHRAQTLSAEIALDPGPRLRFGALTVTSPSRVRAERIHEIAGLPTGETFSPDELGRSAQRLRRTGAFSSVALSEAETPGPDGTLGIAAAVVDAKPRRFGVGAELSSIEGLALSGFWMHRNLLGGAERLRVEGEIGGLGGRSGGSDYRLSTRLDRPATLSPDTGLFVLGELEELNEPDYTERSAALGVGLSHVFSDRLSGEIGLTLRYAEVKDDLGRRDLNQLLVPGALTWDSRDDPLDASKGYYLGLEATPFLGLSGGDSGARLYADARAYRGLGGAGRFVLAGRVQAGSVFDASVADVPPDMLFFSGGGGTVRGQPYQSLAVDLGGGKRVGGRSFLGLSGELRMGVSDTIGLVGFADAGYIGAGSLGQGSGEWHSGAGLGLRYATGIGPIRLDVATPLDGGKGGRMEIYIGIGQAF
ncbi:autotransporter assembly complex family protein [Actibacterium sp. MT2.3-13A]|uniref:autotransporter assembly complex protein TamA n=1 Tax=Actibacterium sp. MT2.3-13A TaxID=2828332 RepID=UPI002013C014|nr:autotransporter assembly complex family protein [Actibacterium sp. MT2.3-13A]